ncbi:MAG: hypothetical protein CL677_10820 [Bdellovibrionaceae bacterium]|nr:hypothetical protein [Pseudobdellovibrionaceae bacterium]|tara:strand:- start:15839 stop:16549 length:711 start_codon:yes stop_codon:yes gene_type:complete
MLSAKPIQTEVFKKGMDLESFLLSHLNGRELEGKILAVTSKLVSVSENRFVKKSEIEKEDLVKREADIYLGRCSYDCHLTIKESLLIPSSGIDESNSEGDEFILYPENPFISAKHICEKVKAAFSLKDLGVILTDSHTTPLRRGVSGVALAYYGFNGLQDKVGHKDLFDRPLMMTSINVADALAVAATLVMGEGNECCPLAILDHPVEFKILEDNSELHIPLEEDLYHPMITGSLR